MRRVCRFMVACVAMLGVLLTSGKLLAQTPTQTPAAVVVLKGVVDEYSEQALIGRFEKAKADGARTVILKLDTPGGRVRAPKQLPGSLRSQNPIHTVAFVDHKAYSAGIMIGLACDELV